MTALFADVVGSTTLAEAMDPEDWTQIINEAFDLMSQAIYRYEGTIAQLQGDKEHAKQYFQRVLDVDPRAGIAANNLAWLYLESGEHLDLALQLAQTAVQELPQMPEIQDTLGWVYYKRQLPDRAIVALKEAVRLAPQNPTYHFHLGMAYAQAGDSAQARSALSRALAISGTFSDAAEARQALENLGSDRVPQTR